MKSQHFTLAAFGFWTALVGVAEAGHESNGGNYITSNFVTWGQNIHSFLEAGLNNVPVLSKPELEAFAQVLRNTRVESVSNPASTSFVDKTGAPVHARVVIDDKGAPGQKKIQLEEGFWKGVAGNDQGICRLVFHEYLRVMGIDDDQDAVSWKLSTTCDFVTNANAVNMDFESDEGWTQDGNRGNYTLSYDVRASHQGKRSKVISGKKGDTNSFSAVTQCVDAKAYRNKTLRLIGYLGVHQVSNGYAGLWARVDAGNDAVQFDNMMNRGLTGSSTNWVPNIIELNVPTAATRICFGALLTGDGTMWVDDLQLTAKGR